MKHSKRYYVHRAKKAYKKAKPVVAKGWSLFQAATQKAHKATIERRLL